MVRALLPRGLLGRDPLAPGRVRDQAGAGLGQVDAGVAAEPELVRPRLQRLVRQRVEALAHRVEEDVRGHLECPLHGDRAVRLVAGVAALLDADVDAAGVVDDRAGRRDPGRERGERGDRLERRPRRIGALRRAVERRRAGVLAEQLVEARRRDRPRQDVGIEARVRADGEHVAIAGIHRDERARQPAADLRHRLLCPSLEPEVERQGQLAAGLGLALEVGADRVAAGVDDDAVQAVATAQVAVVAELESALPDDRAGGNALVGALQLLRADLADAAHDLRGELAVGVLAQEDALDVDPRELLLALLDEVAHGLRDVDLHSDRRVRRDRELLDHLAVDRLRAHAEHPPKRREACLQVLALDVGDRGQRDLRPAVALRAPQPQPDRLAPRVGRGALRVRQARRPQLDDGRPPVLDERTPAAVHDRATGRLLAHQAHFVVVGLLAVLVAR